MTYTFPGERDAAPWRIHRSIRYTLLMHNTDVYCSWVLFIFLSLVPAIDLEKKFGEWTIDLTKK